MIKEIENAYRSMRELHSRLPLNRPYVLMIGGREYNVFVEELGTFQLFGRVAQNKIVALIDRPGRGGAVVKVFSPQEEKNAVGPGDELLHSEPCVVPSKTLRIRVALGSIDLIEDPWRPLLGDAAFTEKGIDPDELCKAIPAFSSYRIPGKGFSGSPETWVSPCVEKPHNIDHIADCEKEATLVPPSFSDVWVPKADDKIHPQERFRVVDDEEESSSIDQEDKKA